MIVEEELLGPVFRITFVNQKLAGVLRRDPPQVIGDGHSTIQELVEKENKNPLRQGPVFAKISLANSYAKRELDLRGLKESSVPAVGEVVLFHFKVNWGVGGTSRDATSLVHPENLKLFEDIARYLKDDIFGLDFMIQDISESWRKQKRCGVIECNSLPLIGNHHFPYTGEVRNVAGNIWDMIFPESGQSPEKLKTA